MCYKSDSVIVLLRRFDTLTLKISSVTLMLSKSLTSDCTICSKCSNDENSNEFSATMTSVNFATVSLDPFFRKLQRNNHKRNLEFIPSHRLYWSSAEGTLSQLTRLLLQIVTAGYGIEATGYIVLSTTVANLFVEYRTWSSSETYRVPKKAREIRTNQTNLKIRLGRGSPSNTSIKTCTVR